MSVSGRGPLFQMWFHLAANQSFWVGWLSWSCRGRNYDSERLCKLFEITWSGNWLKISGFTVSCPGPCALIDPTTGTYEKQGPLWKELGSSSTYTLSSYKWGWEEKGCLALQSLRGLIRDSQSFQYEERKKNIRLYFQGVNVSKCHH